MSLVIFTAHVRDGPKVAAPPRRRPGRFRPGTEGTIWLNHFLRTGMEMFTTGAGDGYLAEKAESDTGWLFPVGDEVTELGYVDMLTDMFDAMDHGTAPAETFYDGYVVNAVIDACYRSAESKQREPIDLDWRGGATPRLAPTAGPKMASS